jgi:hypothetical protein
MHCESDRGLKGSQRRQRQARGAAYVEAILLVCFMIVIFAGVQYLARYFDAKQQALGTARRCAWIFSRDACVRDPDCGQQGHIACLPADCEEALGFTKGQTGNVEDEPNEELGTNIKNAEDSAEAQGGKPTDGSEAQKNLKSGVEEKMGPMMQMVVGQSLTATVTHHIDPPRLVPNAQSNITVSYYMPCNLAHQDAFDVAMSLFFDLLPGGL